MFKIESYITPLLMGYVDKYVKLRPEDFQLSLWGGDAVLYNLDLRLDVIEKAIQLPIVFQSGHIHELRLHIPWTKLGSDPVVITINTIECILKLRDKAYTDRKSSRSGSETPSKTRASSAVKPKSKRPEADELPPGYLQSLMNKIMNNVDIIVNNLIVKFVEDDIVLSLNVKSAECYSVNKDWNRAFTELTAPDFALRRNINFCDLTVCLDKRDASGKIENYQDPMVYRCSVSGRLYSKYDSINAKFPSETKLNMYCERLDISLTDTQLPMLIRLIEMCLALYYGTMEFKKAPVEDDPDALDVRKETDAAHSVGEPPPQGEMPNQGWASWAWSYVPQLIPDIEIEEEEDEEQQKHVPRKKPPPSIFTLGMYAYKLSVKFKLTELQKAKSHYGPRKVLFKPFLYLESEGISVDILMQGIYFFNAQFGISNISIVSQGPCICGAEGEENTRNHVLLSGGDQLTNKTTINYMSQSLFDQQSPENLGIPISKIVDFDEHKQVYTEQYGLQKFGVFWMDYLYSMARPDDDPNHSSQSSVASLGELALFVKENSLSRFLIGQCHLNVASTTVHRVQKLLDAAYKYEYEPYSKKEEERVDPNRPAPTDEQLSSLEEFIPIRTNHLTLIQPIISFLSAEHPYCDIATKKYKSQSNRKHGSTSAGSSPLQPLFGIQLTSQRFDLQVTSPMYPRKLVQLVSMVVGPPSNLLHHCHSHTQIKLFGFNIGLTKVDTSGVRSPLLTILPPASGAMYTRRLLLPMYWNNSYLPKLEKVYELPQVSISLSKPALLIVMAVVSSWKQFTPKPSDVMNNSLMDDVFPAEEEHKAASPVLEVELSGFEMKTCRNDLVTSCCGTISSVHALLYLKDSTGTPTSATPILHSSSNTECLHSPDWLVQENYPIIEDVTNDFITFTYQLPRKPEHNEAPSVMLVNIEGVSCCLDPALQAWFQYEPSRRGEPSKELAVELDLALVKAASPLQGNISQISQPSSDSKKNSMSFTQSQSQTTEQQTKTSPPDKGENHDSPKPTSGADWLAKIFPVVKIIQVQVEMKKTCFFLPRSHINLPEPSIKVTENLQLLSRSGSMSLPDLVVVALPQVHIQSTGLKTVSYIQDIPITSTEGSLVGDKIPWNMSLKNFSIYTLHQLSAGEVEGVVGGRIKSLWLVQPTSVSCTVGVSYKYTPPTSDNISSLGLCLHTDMQPVVVAASFKQIKLMTEIITSHIKLATKTSSFMSDIAKSFTAEKLKKFTAPQAPPTTSGASLRQPTTISATSVTEGDLAYTATSCDMSPSHVEIVDSEMDGVKLSLWLQWTLPKCEMRLYLLEGQESKLSLLLEDITLSVDVQDVYSKVKVNVGAANLTHWIYQDSKWTKGPNQGILLSCRDQLSHNTHIVTSRLWAGDQQRGSTLTSSSMFQTIQPAKELSHGFLSVTFTRALRKNVRQRLQKMNIEVMTTDGASSADVWNKFFFHKYVSEVCVSLNPCDTVLSLSPFFDILNNIPWLPKGEPHKKAAHNGAKVKPSKGSHSESAVPLFTSSSLPLVYADIANMRMFIPGQAVGKEEKDKRQDKVVSTIDHDTFIIQVQSVNVCPYADNPLPRYPLDKSLYQQAVQLGITSESGAALADRQFQVDMKGFSITTGVWDDFVTDDGTDTQHSQATPSTQIPAVEWNALSSLNDQQDLQLFPLISPCDMRLVAAPAMVNCRPGFGSKGLEWTLICGHSLEFNVISDLELFVSNSQVHLMAAIVDGTMKKFKTSQFEKPEASSDEHLPDSGLGSEISLAMSQPPKIILDSEKEKFSQESSHSSVPPISPIDILLTAGRISCTLYSHNVADLNIKTERKKAKQKEKIKKKKSKIDLEWRIVNQSEDSEGGEGMSQHDGDTGYQDPYFMRLYETQTAGESLVISAGSSYIKPFFFLYISQPHTVLSCQPGSQKFETSCFDLLLKGPADSCFVPMNELKLLPDCSDFKEYWLETRAGQPDRITGIPPCMYTLTVTDFLQGPANVNLRFGRPVRGNMSLEKLGHIQQFVHCLVPTLKHLSADTSGGSPESQPPSSPSLRQNREHSTTKSPSLLTKIHHVELATEQMVVVMETGSCDQSPGILGSFSNLKLEMDFQQSSPGITKRIGLTSYMRDLYIKTTFTDRPLNLIGPCSVKVDGAYSAIFHDNKHYGSHCAVTIATGMVTVNIGQEHALCLLAIADHMKEFMKELQLTTTPPQSCTPKFEASADKPRLVKDYIVQSSSDDLRSGAFKYFMNTVENSIPNPGEIFFCDEDKGGNSSMTWTYSQPRVITHVMMTPVPFTLTTGNRGDGKLQCALQYWEGLIQQYVDLCDLVLSENEVTETHLPDVKMSVPRDLVVSHTWRIVIRHCDNSCPVPPTSLAAAVKVDSSFIPSLIPGLQLGCTIESLHLRLSNHVHCLGKESPTRLQPFCMSDWSPATGEFAVISLDNILVAGSQFTGKQARTHAQFTSTVTVDLLEYRALTMQRVVTPVEVSGLMNLHSNSKPAWVEMDVSCEPVTVRVGQGVVHTLSCAAQAWGQILNDSDSENEEVVFSHYVICNDTQQPIRFGQVGTDENLVLQPREMHQYCWRSHKMKQEIHMCLDGRVWKWCDAVNINKEGTIVRTVTSDVQNFTLIIAISKLSNVQLQVTISGQLIVCNLLSQHLEVKVMTFDPEVSHSAVVGSEQIIPSYIVEMRDVLGMKFRPLASKGVWSKEVPVWGEGRKENNLVKITLSDKSSFHIWCRVFQQAVNTAVQVFVVLCPLYTVRSHLPYPLYMNIDTSKLNLHQQIEAPGRGHDLQLICAGGDIHHALTFQFSATSSKSTSGVTLSTGLIDQLKRAPPKAVDSALLKSYWKRETWWEWPYIQELKIDETSLKPNKLPVSVPEQDCQPTIDLSISLSELWPGCPTVLVEVTPHHLINNRCDVDLVVMGDDDMTFDLPKEATISPPKLKDYFHIGLIVNDKTFMSEAIPLSTEEVNEQRYRTDIGRTLYLDSYVNMPIFADINQQHQVYFVTVTSVLKHQIRVITIQPRYNWTNLTPYSLSVCTLSVPYWSEKVDMPSDNWWTLRSHRYGNKATSDLEPMTFHPLKYSKDSDTKLQLDHATEFLQYVTFRQYSGVPTDSSNDLGLTDEEKENSSETLNISKPSPGRCFASAFPIRLLSSDQGRRMTSSMIVESDGQKTSCEALCISGQQKNGVTYFVVQLDSAPSCYIRNKCQFPLYFGQTLMNLSLSGTTIQEQTELVTSLPRLPSGGSTYYTPPFINSSFPQISETQSIPKLHIAGTRLNSDQSNLTTLKWSQPIDLHVAADHFVPVPDVGDVKVHVKLVSMVTIVSFEPVSKADVSAKEIRSRLKGKDRTIIVESKELASGHEKQVLGKINGENFGDDNLNDKSGAMKADGKETVMNDDEWFIVSRKQKLQVSAGFFLSKLSLIIQDELSSTTRKGELLQLTVSDVFVATYPVSDYIEENKLHHHRNCFVLSAGDVQLDNQVYSHGNFDFSVVLVRSNFEKQSRGADFEQLSQMHIIEKHAVLKSSSIMHVQMVLGSMHHRASVIESVEISAKPLDFYVDDTFIFRCIKEFEGFIPVPLSQIELLPVTVVKLPLSVKSNSKSLACPVLIGHLLIQPLSVMLSVHASLKLFVASDHTPLSFGKFEKRHVCTTPYQLIKALAMHYASGALFRAGAVVGSLEILGNPTGLVRSIGTGVADFFRMPYKGLTQGPGAFVYGVSRGTSSMLKHVTTGMLTSVTNFASSVSRNMDRLSLDGSHVERQEESRRHRPDGVGVGLKQGLTGLGLSLLGAVAGLADQPLQSLIQREVGGTRSSAASGLVSGMGKGLVGVFTKPLGGAAEFVSQTGQGILHGTGLSRYPRPHSEVVVIDIGEEPCGQLKYALKLLPSNDILLCIEASYVDLTNSLTPVTLILTPFILFIVNHEEDSVQQSFSLQELQCSVTLEDTPLLSIIWRDAHTYTDDQVGPSDTERVTAFIDGTISYLNQRSTNQGYDRHDISLNLSEPLQSADIAEVPHGLQSGISLRPPLHHLQTGSGTLALLPISQEASTTRDEECSQGRQSDSCQGEQLSDTNSECSSVMVDPGAATLPKYDFHMSATQLAAFLAIFNITKNKLEGFGFAV